MKCSVATWENIVDDLNSNLAWKIFDVNLSFNDSFDQTPMEEGETVLVLIKFTWVVGKELHIEACRADLFLVVRPEEVSGLVVLVHPLESTSHIGFIQILSHRVVR
jgi:hypothetical protein